MVVHTSVDGAVFGTELQARVCKACGEAHVEKTLRQRFELQVAAEVARMGRPTATAFRFMRQALGLRCSELAELLCVERSTLSRWENGVMRVDRGAFVVLAGLVADRLAGRGETLAHLNALRRPARLPEGVILIKSA
jgi:DNA-binding transcriptional regulator YiaG